MVRVAADVAFLATRPVVEVRDFVFLPVMASDTRVPAMVAKVPVTAVMMAFSTFDTRPGFFLPPFSVLADFASFSVFSDVREVSFLFFFG